MLHTSKRCHCATRTGSPKRLCKHKFVRPKGRTEAAEMRWINLQFDFDSTAVGLLIKGHNDPLAAVTLICVLNYLVLSAAAHTRCRS